VTLIEELLAYDVDGQADVDFLKLAMKDMLYLLENINIIILIMTLIIIHIVEPFSNPL